MLGVILILICLGLVFFGIEFVVPGGLVGVLGGAAMLSAVVLTYIEYGALAGFIVAVFAVSTSTATLIVWMKYFHKSRLGKALVLDSQIEGADSLYDMGELLGKRGVAKTNLHPTGLAEIAGRRIDVVGETGLIDAGSPVEVVRVQGAVVTVRKTKS
ncbi:MAG: NfeD family protein [Verrucomicrobiota bacterium]